MKTIKKLLLISIILSLSCSSQKIKYHINSENKKIMTGLENFIKNYSHEYKGKKAIVVTNHSGVDFELNKNINLFRAKGINVIMIMAPEHGLYGYQNEYDKKLYSEDENLNSIVYNLHKLNKKSIRFLFKKTDIVIFDIQDMGMRCYTYISNLKYLMDILNNTGKRLIVLDRPNPLDFLGVDGAFLNRKFKTKYISAFPVPFLYQMTIGEAALYYKRNYTKNLNLRIIMMRNYKRNMLYPETGLPWIPPSPNLPTYESSIVYSAVVLLEGINLSLGRGTTKPFEYIGAPWIDPYKFAEQLKKLNLKTFHFRPVYFKPTFSKYKDKKCGGVQIFYTGDRFSPTEVSYIIISLLFKKYLEVEWTKFRTWYDIDYLAGTNLFRLSINKKKSYNDYKKKISRKVTKFIKTRENFELYF